MSFKSLPGVLEDMEVPENARNGVRGLEQPLGSFPESFITIKHLEPFRYQNFLKNDILQPPTPGNNE